MILLVTNEFPPVPGGVGTYCYEMCRAFYKFGHGVTVVAAQKGSAAAFDRKLSFPMHRVPEYRVSVFRHAARFAAVARVVVQNRPSVLWAADWRSAIGLLPFSRRRRLPLAVMSHGSDVLIASSSPLARRVARLVYDRADIVLSNSAYTASLLTALGVDAAKIVVTSLGVDPSVWNDDPARRAAIEAKLGLTGRRVILSLSRLTPRKGQDVLIQALPAVLRAAPDGICVIAGTGEDEPRLRCMVAELGLEQAVVFAGFVEEADKPAYYHACDVYTILSRRDGLLVEGFGITLLEAAACGKPVVAGNHGGVAEAVIADQTGLLVDPLDPDQVAAALIDLLTDPAKAERFGRYARMRVEQTQTWEAVAQRTLEAFARR